MSKNSVERACRSDLDILWEWHTTNRENSEKRGRKSRLSLQASSYSPAIGEL